MTMRSAFILVACLTLAAPAVGADTFRLKENFAVDYQYHVSTRTELSGSLTIPAEKPGQNSNKLALRGSSSIEYDERVLSLAANGQVQKTARLYRRLDFERRVGDRSQSNSLRPNVRRLVVLRHQQMEVPYSPDGPLTWGELDLVRTDVFTPSLAGLFPSSDVSVGNRWPATGDAVKELTDLERIEEGGLECSLEGLTTVEKRRCARVTFTGTVRGVNEDGPNRQRIEGYCYFDLDSNHLSYLYLKGTSSLLDKSGAIIGDVEGQFVLTRHAQSSLDLSEQSLRGVALEPNAENTLLQYDHAESGVRFLHPRRWRVTSVSGPRITLDESSGGGLLITLEPANRTPTGAQFQSEVADWLKQQKATIVRSEPVRRIASERRPIEQFGFEADLNGNRVSLEYFVTRHTTGGATLAARLSPRDASTLRGEVERIARSLTITPPATGQATKPK